MSRVKFSVQIFFDDSIRNIQAGKRIGLHTVLVNPLYPVFIYELRLVALISFHSRWNALLDETLLITNNLGLYVLEISSDLII